MGNPYSPDAIKACYDVVKAAIGAGCQLGGMYANKPGYHNCRAQLPSSDYSVQKSYDQKGDAWAASALDITPGSTSWMQKMTQRLIDETKANGDTGALRGVREFYGTLDGYSVVGMDVPGRYWCTSDPSHTWHEHVSGKREAVNDAAAWADVAAILTGGGAAPPTPEPEDEMEYTSSSSHAARKLTKGQWSTLYNDDDNSQTFVTAPAHFMAELDLTDRKSVV